MALEDAIELRIWRHGVTVVASVANDGSTAASYPAGYAGVIGVAATDQNDNLASFSNSGASVYISAPGVSIPTLAVGGATYTGNGTSMAAAQVAGAAALLAADKGLTPAQIAGALSSTADGGRLNLGAALGAVDAPAEEPVKDDSGPVGDGVYGVDAEIQIFDQCRNGDGGPPEGTIRRFANGRMAT